MPRDEQKVPRHVRDEQILALARTRKYGTRQIAAMVGTNKTTVYEVIRKDRDPAWRRPRYDVDDDSITAFEV